MRGQGGTPLTESLCLGLLNSPLSLCHVVVERDENVEEGGGGGGLKRRRRKEEAGVPLPPGSNTDALLLARQV